MEISLDRLTVCGNEFGDVAEYYSVSEYVKNETFAKYPYRYAVEFLDGSVLQIAEKEAYQSGAIKKLRYDFNPAKTDYDKLHIQVVRMLKDVHVTRVDVAFDVYDMDMARWKWIDSKGRPYNVYYSGAGEIETWYVGGKNSDIRIRIYNKAKEQRMRGKVWWRVEVQLRGEAANLYGVMSRKGNVDINPFRDVTPVVDGDFPELDIKKRAMVKYLIECPTGFAELSSKTRAEYKRLIRLVGSWECINFFDVWQEKSSLVASEVGSWIDLAFDPLAY